MKKNVGHIQSQKNTDSDLLLKQLCKFLYW